MQFTIPDIPSCIEWIFTSSAGEHQRGDAGQAKAEKREPDDAIDDTVTNHSDGHSGGGDDHPGRDFGRCRQYIELCDLHCFPDGVIARSEARCTKVLGDHQQSGRAQGLDSLRIGERLDSVGGELHPATDVVGTADRNHRYHRACDVSGDRRQSRDPA